MAKQKFCKKCARVSEGKVCEWCRLQERYEDLEQQRKTCWVAAKTLWDAVKEGRPLTRETAVWFTAEYPWLETIIGE